jgi:tetratricopeptide (TPR) repeat protein
MLNPMHIFSIALKHHQAGDLVKAEELYRRIIAVEPRHADALHLLGVMANQVGKPQVAVDLISRAIAINPTSTAYHNNIANALKACGDTAKAETSYQQALVLDKRNADAHYNLGRLFEEQGRLEEASRSYKSALRCAPGMVVAHISLGDIATKSDNANLAVQHCKAAVRSAPRHAPAQNALGNALLAVQEMDTAKACYERAIAINPSYADAHYNLGNVLRSHKNYAGALESYKRAIELSPEQADVYNNMGRTHAEMGNHEKAIRWFNRAIELSPGFLKAYQNLGVSQEAQGNLAAATTSYHQGLELQPEHQDLRTNLGSVLVMQGYTDGIRYLEQIVGEQPHSAEAHWWLSAALLLQGDYVRGWREYEWRWQRENFISPRREFNQPQWQGKQLNGDSILLHAEQGLGDTLQFVRYASLVAERGGRVILEVQAGLHRLLEHLPGVSVCLKQGDSLPEFSCHCPLMSLPFVFGTTMETIPPIDRYLSTLWGGSRSPIPTTHDRLKVGLVWAGNPGHLRDRMRSISLKQFLPLGSVASVSFISLQKGAAAIQAIEGEFHLANLLDTAKDFYDSAAVVAELDLVITVDTSVAHLAGALGKPVWILLANLPDWRWGLQSDTTPWYPTARLFRQTYAGGWEEVINKLASELALFANSKRISTAIPSNENLAEREQLHAV